MYCTKCGKEVLKNVVETGNKKKLVSKKDAISAVANAFSLDSKDASFIVGVYLSNKNPSDVADELKCDNADIIMDIRGNTMNNGNDIESNIAKTKRYRINLNLISILLDWDRVVSEIETPHFCIDCGAELPTTYTEKEKKELSLTAHRRENEAYDKTQNSLCFVVIGGILLIVGILFFILSFKSQVGRIGRFLTPGSFEFVVSMAGLISGAILLTIGLIRYFKARKLKKNMHIILEKLKENMI